MSSTIISELVQLRDFYQSGETRSYSFRLDQLKRLKNAVLSNENELYQALYTDLKKSKEESWVTEIGLFIAELNATIRNLKQWMQPEKVGTNLVNLPSSSRIIKEPLGVVLIIGPWNYPFNLLFIPLLGAIAAGNCIVIKSSEFAPATSAAMKKIITENFAPEYIHFIEGEGGTVVPEMMNNFSFDHVFYTGSTAVGKIIYKMAAERLVPVTLELGGKSPCIIEADANLKVAARRVAIGKFTNSGQTCVAPDYVLVQESIKDSFLTELKKAIQSFYDQNPENSYSYTRIINEKQFDRINGYLGEANVYSGGKSNRDNLYIEPTIVVDVKLDSKLMQEEIFGPILPVITYKTEQDAHAVINRNPNPLAFYVFTSSRKREEYWMNNVSFGGGCVNNACWHLTNHHLPFGGRGMSGTGKYHGKSTFDTFSHSKSVLKTPTWLDPNIKYPPFKNRLKLFKWVIR